MPMPPEIKPVSGPRALKQKVVLGCAISADDVAYVTRRVRRTKLDHVPGHLGQK
jgi:hypothetical protein